MSPAVPVRPIVLLLALTLLGACAAPGSAVRSEPSRDRTGTVEAARRARKVVIVAAGDIACGNAPYDASRPERCQYDETAKLTDGRRIARVLPLGDLQYNEGEYEKFVKFYDRWWGVSKRKQRPVPGNHDHAFQPNRKPTGYFRYFGERVEGPNGWGYYSFDLPAGCTPGRGVCWHLIALNSEICFATGGCDRPADPSNPGIGEQMWRWLRRDLARHPNADYRCTVAYFHHPLFSFSSASGGQPAVRALWRLLYRARVDVVLNGHSHNYQRWKPQSPAGEAQPRRGIRQFIVGTGGASTYDLKSGAWPPNLVKAQDRSFGVLRMALLSDGYRWAWRTADGQPGFADRRRQPVACT